VTKSYSISELATEFGVTARTIRFYEEKGLLSPSRNGQDRVYSRGDYVRLNLILRGKRLGFSLADIEEMMGLYDRGDEQAEQLRVTRQKSQDRLDALKQQRRDIDEAIEELQDICTEIDVHLNQKGVVNA
jgi:DNA-binding transcriptional MerR regulator